MIFEDKVVPNLRTYRAACKAAAAAGEFEKCEELLDDVKDAVQIAQGARFWGPRDHAACFEGVLKACRGRGAWKEANVLERLENGTAENNEDDVERSKEQRRRLCCCYWGLCPQY